MLSYTGHPFVDIGIATLAAFHNKPDPGMLDQSDLEQAADFMAKHYTVDPMQSFLTVVFPNSGFTQPAYQKTPEKREIYADKVLRAFQHGTSSEKCIFTGQPAAGVPFDVKDELPAGRAFRQHIPLLTGEDVINFFPYGRAGLPISGLAMLALQALPLGCAKVQGKLLAVHSDDPKLTYAFASRFLDHNRKAILAAGTASQEGEKARLPEYPRQPGTLIIEMLREIEEERSEFMEEHSAGVSLTAYYFSNFGQNPDMHIYHLPMEIVTFLRIAQTPRYRKAWDALVARGWEIVKAGGKRTDPSFNILYEDLFGLPENAAQFIRKYFLRRPTRSRRPGDPSATYSIQSDIGLISWE